MGAGKLTDSAREAEFTELSERHGRFSWRGAIAATRNPTEEEQDHEPAPTAPRHLRARR